MPAINQRLHRTDSQSSDAEELVPVELVVVVLSWIVAINVGMIDCHAGHEAAALR